jgi:hypothetical protein
VEPYKERREEKGKERYGTRKGDSSQTLAPRLGKKRVGRKRKEKMYKENRKKTLHSEVLHTPSVRRTAPPTHNNNAA